MVGRTLIVVLVLLASAFVGAQDSVAYDQHELDLSNDHPGLVAYGPNAKSGILADFFGFSITHSDFNGDGIEDMVVTAPFSSPFDRNLAGTVYVVLGSDDPQAENTLDLSDGSQSFTIYGASASDRLGYDYSTQAHGGDMNGDGIDDIVIGAPNAGPPFTIVLFGSASLGSEDGVANGCGDGVDNGGDGQMDAADPDCYIDLAQGTDDFDILTILGAGWAPLVRDVGGPTGVNGVNYGDLIVTNLGTGKASVLFGQEDFEAQAWTVDLTDPPEPPNEVSITTIHASDPEDSLGWGLNVRNVNGDGLKFSSSDRFHDIIIGAPLADGPDDLQPDTGEVYIVNGRSTWPDDIYIANGEQDYTIYGSEEGERFGKQVYSGDINGDNFNDIVVSAELANHPNWDSTQDPQWEDWGAAFVIYGSGTLSGKGSETSDDADVTIYPAAKGDAGSIAPVHTGRLNNDRYADVILGHREADNPGGGTDTGAVYVLRGGSAGLSGTIFLGDGEYDYAMYGGVNDKLGFWIAAADINGDGISDVLASALFQDGPDGDRTDAGAVYALFDSDVDGTTNRDDPDDDNDGVNDSSDNCPFIPNSNQADNDSDGTGDACDDSDGDSLGKTYGPIRPFFTDAIELHVGTYDAQDACGPGLWPPDFDDDGTVDDDDIFAWVFGSVGIPRSDLNGNGSRDSEDYWILRQYYGESCSGN